MRVHAFVACERGCLCVCVCACVCACVRVCVRACVRVKRPSPPARQVRRRGRAPSAARAPQPRGARRTRRGRPTRRGSGPRRRTSAPRCGTRTRAPSATAATALWHMRWRFRRPTRRIIYYMIRPPPSRITGYIFIRCPYVNTLVQYVLYDESSPFF